MEGPGIATIEDGKLLLYSKYHDITIKYLEEQKINFSGTGELFYNAVEPAMRADIGDSVNAYYEDGIFRGGHLVYWNKFKTPDNYILECDFQSLSPNALHMLMISCTGTEGQDVFDPSLKKRFGVARQYTPSDLYNYRVLIFSQVSKNAAYHLSKGHL